MIDTRVLEELGNQLSKLLPPGAIELKEDFERNIRASLEAALARMELVTREEFDVQTALLQRARERLEELEARVAELEVHILKQEEPPAE